MTWAYGLVEHTIHVSPEESYKYLVLCEIYESDKMYMSVPIEWDDITKKDVKLILKDLKAQMSNEQYHFVEEDFQEDKQ